VLSRIASSEGSSYTGSNTTSSAKQGVLLRIINHDPTNYWDDSGTATGTSSAPAASTLTPTYDNCLNLAGFASDDDDVTDDSGYTSGYTGIFKLDTTYSNDSSLMLQRKEQTTATATGSITMALDASEEWIAFNILIAPTAASGTDYTQDVLATAIAVATITKKVKKRVPATAVAVATTTKKTGKRVISTALAVPTVVKKVKKPVLATAVAVATTTQRLIYAALLQATVVAVATITTHYTTRVALNATVTAVATATKKVKKNLAATALAVPTVVKKVKKPLGIKTALSNIKVLILMVKRLKIRLDLS
jgi:hypothetical protein